MNKFAITGNWRLRKQLDDDFLTDILDYVATLQRCRDERNFDKGNFEYSMNQLAIKSRKMRKFYNETK